MKIEDCKKIKNRFNNKNPLSAAVCECKNQHGFVMDTTCLPFCLAIH